MADEPARESLPDATRLAIDRTRLAVERTTMAWVRTSASMITFGFTIYKFFQLDRASGPAASHTIIGTREFALLLIAIGLVSLALAAAQQRRDLQTLRVNYPGARIPVSLAGLLAVLMSLIGVTALLAVVFKL